MFLSLKLQLEYMWTSHLHICFTEVSDKSKMAAWKRKWIWNNAYISLHTWMISTQFQRQHRCFRGQQHICTVLSVLSVRVSDISMMATCNRKWIWNTVYLSLQAAIFDKPPTITSRDIRYFISTSGYSPVQLKLHPSHSCSTKLFPSFSRIQFLQFFKFFNFSAQLFDAVTHDFNFVGQLIVLLVNRWWRRSVYSPWTL